MWRRWAGDGMTGMKSSELGCEEPKNPAWTVCPQVTWGLLACLCACGATVPDRSDTDWAEALVRADPMFGGGDAFVKRLWGHPEQDEDGEPEARIEFVTDQSAVLDREARQRVLATAGASWRDEVLAFLKSDAGQALVAAETLAVTGYPYTANTFPRECALVFGDPAAVGETARRKVNEVAAAMERGERGFSPSPAVLSLTLGAILVSPEHATAIHVFYGSPAGKSWMAARLEAWPAVQARYSVFRAAAIERGVMRWTGVDLPDLILPK